jgi:3-isopropylmalate/(R)-2-methylmalate dehydratase small subunit
MANETILRGKAWVCGDYIDSYKILPELYWKGGSQIGNLNMEELGKHAMEGADQNFAAEARSGKFSFIIAGRNFGGGGKSIEHPIYAIKGARVKAVITESSSRYFFRNAINNGLPILICEGITSKVKTGDDLEVDLSSGEIRNLTTGAKIKSAPIPEGLMKILMMGGYIPYTRKRMAMASSKKSAA